MKRWDLDVGLVYALNTGGAILGSLITGFLLTPLLGLQMTVVALAMVNLSIGVAAFWLSERATARGGSHRRQRARWRC